MKLKKTHHGYVCASDPRLQFHSRRGCWELRLDGRCFHTFSTLAEAQAFARQHWRPNFFRPVLERLEGDGLRLWDAAVMGDRHSFCLLLDWVEEHLPDCLAGIGRESLLRQAEECGLFRVRRVQARERKRPPPVTARIEGGELVLSGLGPGAREMAARFAGRSPRWYMPAEDTLRCELAAPNYPPETRLPMALEEFEMADGLLLILLDRMAA
jgi:hypothetical protein